CQQISRAPVTF
nr:immunoglobulin light chain junction region [Macaca mulatta]MOX53241.1 immunoglobulin light chain junction region [Macaca mulatta]